MSKEFIVIGDIIIRKIDIQAVWIKNCDRDINQEKDLIAIHVTEGIYEYEYSPEEAKVIFDKAIKDMNEENCEEKVDHDPIVDQSIDSLFLSIRCTNCLKSAGINTIGDLMSYSLKQLIDLRISGFGKGCEKELLKKLEERKIQLKSY